MLLDCVTDPAILDMMSESATDEATCEDAAAIELVVIVVNWSMTTSLPIAYTLNWYRQIWTPKFRDRNPPSANQHSQFDSCARSSFRVSWG